MMRLGLLLLLAIGCAPDLRDDFPFDGTLPPGNYLENIQQSDGLTLSTIDATHKESYVYVDLDTGKTVSVDDQWDLSFQRFKISANGGSSGAGTVQVAMIQNSDFASLTRAPMADYRNDSKDTVFNGVDGGWYFYDLGKHKLVTKEDRFYIVKTDTAYFKLKMKSYYDTAGTAARLQFWWAPILMP